MQAKMRYSGGEVICKYLGVGNLHQPPKGELQRVGSLAYFEDDGLERPYLLCGQITGSRWLCHPGHFRIKDSRYDTCFDIKALTEKDMEQQISSEALAADADAQERAVKLQGAAVSGQESFAMLVAAATFRGEALRAEADGHPLDWSRA
eukprot:11118388-Karenia_brevis.AAC.1